MIEKEKPSTESQQLMESIIKFPVEKVDMTKDRAYWKGMERAAAILKVYPSQVDWLLRKAEMKLKELK